MLIAVGVLAGVCLAVFRRQAGERLPALDAHIDKPVHTDEMRKKGGYPAPVTDKGAAMACGEAQTPANVAADAFATVEESENLTEEERRKQEEKKQVNAFNALTDKWMAPVKGGVSMEDVDAFAAQFKKVPKTQREECLQRALNLVPDENVMLLAGILMDKSQDRGLMELVYNDVLNRDEDVKKAILRQIFADRKHPCWKDAAWVLDGTGALPREK